MTRFVCCLLLLAAAPLAAQTAPEAEALLVRAESSVEGIGLYLIQGDDGALYLANAHPGPSAALGEGIAPLPPALQNRWDGAWAGAKKGMLVGAIAGGVLIAAGLAYDLSGACADCFIPASLFAVPWGAGVFAGATAGGAIIGFALDDD